VNKLEIAHVKHGLRNVNIHYLLHYCLSGNDFMLDMNNGYIQVCVMKVAIACLQCCHCCANAPTLA